ncbi:hypothetical protein SAMN05880556_101897 [Azospirillum sp. RU38E]|nr:hypothetical protein SAMN05880556_101897 [Azospirillum sp. RU38E]SNS14773.1 hypothetical protein SAMN05880591_101897 [Azospirillum sp. RU37A]
MAVPMAEKLEFAKSDVARLAKLWGRAPQLRHFRYTPVGGYPPISAFHSSSDRMVTPSSCALAALDPASAPAIR